MQSINCKEKLRVHHFTQVIKPSQLTFTCSESTIKTLEKGVKYVQS